MEMTEKDKKMKEEAEAELFSTWFSYNQAHEMLERARKNCPKIGLLEELQKRCDDLLEKYNKIQRFLRD